MENYVTFHSPIKGQPTINVQEKIPRSLGVPQELIQMEWQLKEIGKIVIMDVQVLLESHCPIHIVKTNKNETFSDDPIQLV